VAVAWPNTRQLDEFTSLFGVKGHENYDELFERDDVDIVQIAAPVSDIHDLTIRCARAGKHIILGKPMAMNVAQADRMVDAVEAAGITCVAYQGIMRLRFADLKARIDSGEIGTVILLHHTSRWSIAEDWHNSGTPGWF